jgi:hypothetical protein
MTVVDIWVMQDYDTTSQVWSHKYHITLQLASIRALRADDSQNVMVVHEETTDVFVLYNFGQTLVLADTKSKALAISRLDGYIVFPSTQRIRESLVRHSFFSALLQECKVLWMIGLSSHGWREVFSSCCSGPL